MRLGLKELVLLNIVKDRITANDPKPATNLAPEPVTRVRTRAIAGAEVTIVRRPVNRQAIRVTAKNTRWEFMDPSISGVRYSRLAR